MSTPSMSGVTLAAGEVTVGEYTEWQLLGFTIHVNTVISTLLAALIVVGLGVYLGATARPVPSGLQLAFETVTDQIERQVESNLGIRTAPFVVPLAVTLFFFILIANWLAILPHAWDAYLGPPAADINLTLALALFVMILVWVTGIRVKGRHYFTHFVKPHWIMLPLNIIEELVKPVTLSLRLFGNILAGTVMISVIGLLPAFLLWFPTGAWKLFELFIGVLQALIFALLTILYFGFAAGPDHEEAH